MLVDIPLSLSSEEVPLPGNNLNPDMTVRSKYIEHSAMVIVAAVEVFS